MQTTRRAWLVTALVFAFMVINFADKAVLGLSSGQIIDELGLSHAEFGRLGSSFFLLFAISGVLVGFLADKVTTKVLMAVMALLWSATVLPLVATVSFGVLLATRIVLGAAEGPAFPVAMHAVHKWFPDSRRAVPTSVVACGAAFGTGVVAPGLAWVISHHSWHAAFGTLGVVGLAWVVLWLLLGREGSVDAAEERSADEGAVERADEARVPTWRLLTCRTLLGVYLAGFGAYWILSLNIVWLANYLGEGTGLTLSQAALVIALPSVMQIVLAPGLAFVSQRLTLRGVPTRVSRGLTGTGCVVLAGAALTLMPQLSMGPLEVVVVGLAFSVGSVVFTLGTTLVGEVAPRAQRGGALGVTNSIHTLAGLVAPSVMGSVVDAAGSPAAGFRSGFVSAGLLVVVLGVVAAVLVDPAGDARRLRAARTPLGVGR